MRSLAIILICLLAQITAAAPQKRCLYINSYHEGYAWSDGIRKALKAELQGVCILREERLDSKHHPEPAFLKRRARAIMQVVEDWKPDIVIASDDNSIRWVVQPWLRNSDIPVVFCGLNWSMEEYGLPYRNTTGMIEVAPIRPLFRQVKRIVRPARRALYIDTDNLTGHKDLERHQRVGSQIGIRVDGRLVHDMTEWMAALAAGQDYDFIILGSSSGIRGWAQDTAVQEMRRHNRRLVVTVYRWIMPLAHYGLVKLASEQGHWAGLTATTLLQGALEPSDIAVIANREWDVWTNPALIEANGIEIAEGLLEKAKQVKRP